jgi:transposase
VESGVFDLILEAMNEAGTDQDSVQMIDSTVIRAHQHSAGAKRGAQTKVRTKVLAALAAASRQKST